MKKLAAKITSVLLVAILLLTIFAGCNKASSPLDPKNPVRITLWHYYNGTQLVAFDNMVTQFNQTVGKDMGIQVEAFSPGGVNDLAQEVLDMAEGVVGAGGLPDIFAAYADTAYELKILGLTADLGEYMTDEELAEYVSGFWEEGVLPPDSTATIFPVAKSTEVLQIDEIAWREFVSASEGAVSDANLATWEGVVEASRLYYEYTDALTPDIDGDGRALFGIDSLANYLYITMYQQGVVLLSNQDGKGVINLDDAALRNTFDLFYTPIVHGWFSHAGRYRSDDAKTGEILGYIGSTTGGMYFPDVITYDDGTQKDAQLAVFAMPTFANGKNAAIQQGGGMVVTKSDAQREYASVVFLKWMTEQAQNLRFAVDSAYLPVKTETLYGEEMRGILQEMIGSPDVGTHNSGLIFETVLEQLETHELFCTDPFPGLFEVRRILENSLSDIAQRDREQVLSLMDSGLSHEEAVNQVLGEDAYGEWVAYLLEHTSQYFN